MNSSGSVTSSVMPPQMNAGNSEVDFEEDEVPMPFVGSMIKKVAANPEDEQGMMPGDRLPHMDAATREGDALVCEEEDVSMPPVECRIKDKVTGIPEELEGMQGSMAMTVGVDIVEI
jgi:hypothetical protein